MKERLLERREVCRTFAGAAAACLLPASITSGDEPFRLRYVLASCMYGKMRLGEILPEVRKTSADAVDIWPLRHGDQREQMDEMGHERFAALLKEHGTRLGILTHYDKGPFRLQKELPVAKKFGTKLLITGSRGPKNLAGKELKAAVRSFAEEMKPHVAAAESHGVTIGIENHGGALIRSPDSQRWLADFAGSDHLGIALAPYHLPQDPKLIAGLIGDLGPRLVHFYAWQYGKGCHTKLPKEDELLQLPGRGPLDFAPLLAALRGIGYTGWTEVFMHPVPRGIPILETASRVTAEIDRARRYLERELKRT